MTFGYYIRMKQELQLLKLWSLMLLLEDVQCSTEKFKATSLKNSCHTSSLASYHWREVLHLALRNLRKNNLKHGCMFVGESELSEWNRHFIFLSRSLRFQSCFFQWHGVLMFIFAFGYPGSFCSFITKSWWCVHLRHWEQDISVQWCEL